MPAVNHVSVRRPVKDKVILGIDPGTNVMGYGVLHILDGRARYEVMGVLKLNKYEDHYLRLRKIFERTLGLIDEYLPDELAIEAPFFGKNVQSMLKLGHAQGCAIAAAISRDIPIFEYAPLKIKMAITGNGRASKEQVRYLIQRILEIPDSQLLPELDATDGLAAAYCHYLESVVIDSRNRLAEAVSKGGRTKPAGPNSVSARLRSLKTAAKPSSCKTWEEYLLKHPDKKK